MSSDFSEYLQVIQNETISRKLLVEDTMSHTDRLSEYSYIPTLVLVLCGRTYCYDVKLTCLAKDLIFFGECTAVNIEEHEGRMPG